MVLKSAVISGASKLNKSSNFVWLALGYLYLLLLFCLDVVEHPSALLIVSYKIVRLAPSLCHLPP